MPLIPQIREEDASPEIASIYADIKIVSGLSVVNLIWRHFAVYPGVLPWAWNAASPIVGSTAMESATRWIIETFRLPPIEPIEPEAQRRAHLTPSDVRNIRAVVETYLRGNLINLIALTALKMRIEDSSRPAALLSPRAQAWPQLPKLDPLPHIGDLDAARATQVRALSNLHEGEGADVVPSFYLALARWLGLIEALPRWLSPLYEPVMLRAALADTLGHAEVAAGAMLPAIDRPPQEIATVYPALERFTRLLIPGMVPVCVALHRLLRLS